ncbi:hypothetical protein LRX75_06875 [Rhizobium sp. DKSPLA3]|uniref:Uncharacterized protein n=1 Tax=Rhizobium quercicola TaxID=2901226 RepID=A0A9X1T6H3_9HYPH|nr:hypothetical protein [Rhizobium quercicola]MCD7108763.1 hypothetical protein [Rhizobium quercicola]
MTNAGTTALRDKTVPGVAEKVIEAVKRRNPAAINLMIQTVQSNFLGGELYTVAFDMPDGEIGPIPAYNNRVYVTKKTIEVYGNDIFLLEVLGAKHSKSLFEFLANGDIVSGIIALAVTVLIVPSFLLSHITSSQISVPDWITSGWLLILGFYFGKASGRGE